MSSYKKEVMSSYRVLEQQNTSERCETCGHHVEDDEQYSDDEDLSQNDTTIMQFVRGHPGKQLFLVVTADYCGPCKTLKNKNNLNWHTAKNSGTTFFKSGDAVALCFTIGRDDGGFTSPLLENQGVTEEQQIKVRYYPTILEYSPNTRIWEQVERPVLLSKKWLPM